MEGDTQISPAGRFLRLFVDIKKREVEPAILFFFLWFLIMVVFQILKPLKKGDPDGPRLCQVVEPPLRFLSVAAIVVIEVWAGFAIYAGRRFDELTGEGAEGRLEEAVA
jgi:ATP/ADP translocase